MNNQQKYLAIAILIPILMILIIGLSLLIPVKKIIPPYNLLYATGDYSESFTCLQNKMAQFFPKTMNINFYKIEPGRCSKVKLFTYDFKNDSVSPISFEEAKKLQLKENLTIDSENVYISRNCYTGPDLGLFSMRSNDNDVCLVKGNYRQLLNVKLQHDKNFFYFLSIGWIVTEKSATQEMRHE